MELLPFLFDVWDKNSSAWYLSSTELVRSVPPSLHFAFSDLPWDRFDSVSTAICFGSGKSSLICGSGWVLLSLLFSASVKIRAQYAWGSCLTGSKWRVGVMFGSGEFGLVWWWMLCEKKTKIWCYYRWIWLNVLEKLEFCQSRRTHECSWYFLLFLCVWSGKLEGSWGLRFLVN